MLIPLGFLASAGGGVDTDFDLIESTVLTSGQSSITFSNLGTYSSTYKHLQIRMVTRRADNSGSVRLTFNGSSSGYARHTLYGTGSSVLSNAATSGSEIEHYVTSKSTEPANAYAPAVWDILDAYSTTKNKTVRVLAGTWIPEIIFGSGLWANTSSITSINLLAFGNNFASGSRFSLYGIKG